MSNSQGTSVRKRVIVMGAAGRDFHNFLVALRDDPTLEVVAFTATQIPGIDDRTFPAAVAGKGYPDGVPIRPESELPRLIEELQADEVVFAYSDISHVQLMHKASLVLSCGADFRLMGPAHTMVKSTKPIISVCAVRTGVGKSGISRRIFERLSSHGLKVVDVRHPMPYRDLTAMRVERYASIEDLDRLGVTVEEREEYEPLVELGGIVMAGVDYEAILREAEKEADVVVWDGGNNDWPFYQSDLEIVALDPHRVGHERSYYPGEVNFLRADVLVINKVDSADPDKVEELVDAAKAYNPDARLLRTSFDIKPDNDEPIHGKMVLAVEDGPTVTHGGMPYGAAALFAEKAGAAGLVDPTPYAVGSLRTTFNAYPHMTKVLPAMGYSAEQLADLEATINATPCDVVVIGTPIDLGRLINIDKPAVRVRYEIKDDGVPTLDDVVDGFLKAHGLIH
ncbi:MAG TPA: cyclic 2,3-diphosphoglycerate synthase [Coriobacteriia bacterium]|nr:cyclic 2,3-diphosphoglycerate synthase [Coriobacteriia bacterium]